MTFKFQFPVKLPRFTADGMEAARRAHIAEHGYDVHIPGFEEIIHWRVPPEPSDLELRLYKKKDIKNLGANRYNEIQDILLKKLETFQRMLASPSPRIVRNAATIMTFLDDINDTLGTLGVAARFAAQRMPRQIAKFLTGPAGWLFTAAEIAGITLTLSQLPWKGVRLQHELNAVIRNHPLSKKGRLRALKKVKRLKLSKGEAIEALQTTDNVFGIGVCLGPIVALLQDIPFGVYRHVRGAKVSVSNLPGPLLWFDRQWSKLIKGAAQLSIEGLPGLEKEKGMLMAAYNAATQFAQSYLGDVSPMDIIPDISDIEMPAPSPHHASTLDVIRSEVSSVEEYRGWPLEDKKWMKPTDVFNHSLDEVQHTLKDWEEEHRHDTESMVCNQNCVDAGMNTLAILEGEDNVEFDYDVTSYALLRMLNLNMRFPDDADEQSAKCFAKALEPWASLNFHPSIKELHQIAKENCGFEFTTEVPERTTGAYAITAIKYKSAIYRLQQWWFENCCENASFLELGYWRPPPVLIKGEWYYWMHVRRRSYHQKTLTRTAALDYLDEQVSWLQRYGHEMTQVNRYLAMINDVEKAAIAP